MTLLLLALMGCTEDTARSPIAAALPRTADRAVVIDPDPLLDPVGARVWALDDLGVPSGSDPVEITVDGQAVEVAFDGFGYGLVPLAAGVHTLVQAGTTVTVRAPGAPFPALDASYMVPYGPFTWMEPATGGVLAGTPDRLVFLAPDGRMHDVARPPFEIRGIRTRHIDRNGVLDALVWGGDTVLLLRGRPDGGFTWGGAWAADGRQAVEADAGDTNGDGWPDIAIAWAKVGGGDVDVLEQDAPWTFEGVEPRSLYAEPVSLTIGDATEAGYAQITITNIEGEWERFELSVEGDGYSVAEPATAQLPLDADPGTTVRQAGDLDGEGGEELFFPAPLVSDEIRTIQIWDLAGERPAVSQVNPLAAELAYGDADGDGLVDLFVLESDGSLAISSYAAGRVAMLPSGDFDQAGALALTDTTGDGLAELVVTGDWTAWWRGGTRLVEEWPWWTTTRSPITTLAADALDLGLAVAELDGDATTTELYGIRRDGVDTLLVAYHVSASGTLAEHGTVHLAGGDADGVEVVGCGDQVLAATATGVVLVRGEPLAEVARLAGAIDAVACGPGPLGAAIAVLAGDRILLRDADLGAIDDRPAAGATDLALASIEGVNQVVSCDTQDCSVVRLPFGGGDGIAESAADITLPDGTVVSGAGTLSVSDVNGDGLADLVALDGSRIGLWLSSGDALGRGMWFDTDRGIVGSVVGADIDGDGLGDLVYVTASRNLLAVPRD